MINRVDNNIKANKVSYINAQNPIKSCSPSFCANGFFNLPSLTNKSLSPVNTKLTPEEEKKYTYLLNYLKNTPVSQNSQNLTCAKQLDLLLKNGKLLSKSSHDNSTMLDNLFDIANTKRANGLNPETLISSTLDAVCNPKVVTQTFGDIPQQEKLAILKSLPNNSPLKQDPGAMDVNASGTCAAASIEVTMADKYPAEFARWVSKLSSEEKAVELNVKLDSLSKNKLDAITILNILEAKKKNFSFDKVKVDVKTDDNAYIRANIQNNHWDKGERSVVDVLIQSAIMQLGSQNTYDALTDTRGGNFNSHSQGLIEIEKTFVESLIKNKEITSLVYQQIDEDQNLVGYNCSFDKIQKHITDTIDSGDNVIIGYVLTNETSGKVASGAYNQAVDGLPNKVINGHEITIVDYKKDASGKLTFICVDIDDDNPEYVEYSADWLLPKLHHGGFPAHIVEADEKEIMKNMNN